ncbi:M3 family metallopeptidase [Candidatus Gracilibacteria bacterium]|nr:M3 family metallopeptidase [Candidatus Gracilibacteria bacterium]
MPQGIKQKIRQELKNPEFPNLKFLYSQEVLKIALEVLRELLEEEKQDFEQKISQKYIGLDMQLLSFEVKGENSREDYEELSFETFRDFSELDYFFSILSHYQGIHNDEQMRHIIETFEPEYIAFGNEIAYSKRYYEMMKYCYENLESSSTQHLSPALSCQEREQTQKKIRILKYSLDVYELRGIALNEEKQSRLKEISQKLSELTQKFGNNVLDSKKEFEYIISDESIIFDMPEEDKQVARKKAEEKGRDGFLFDASHSSYSAIMKYCCNGGVRKYFYDARNKFASEGKYDNREIILEILRLRQEKAQILEKNNYAELALHFKMAESPEKVISLLDNISQKARKKAEEEIIELKKYFGLKEISLWDMSYYARKLKEEKYALDERELRKYFELTSVKNGMLEIGEKIFGVKFEKQDMGEYLYNQDIELYKVTKNGVFLSYFLCDFYYNPLKRQGAWADVMRSNELQKISESEPREISKIVLNVCNFQQGTDGKTLLSYSDVETMFHEFGHALHEILSTSEYSELSGFHVEHDFVELPSQLLENWCRHEDGLRIFAKHFDSGEFMSSNMLDTLKILETFGNGFFVLKQNEYALMDMKLHSEDIPQSVGELDTKVQNLAQKLSPLPLGDKYSQHTTFTHLFDGGYAAGYYGYIWAEILEKSVWKKFLDTGSIFDRDVSIQLTDIIFRQGAQRDGKDIFFEFTQSEPSIDAFLEMKGIV